ncbi:Mrx3p NDAI_0E03980 [Naumovozyma dairenensis CBS 421]|uniref:Thioesterase domain-containing protein n=1 Tax=Naumovozyma dairenensis (strain ATCC 10597 / BCRC 20456 / CBS 421 / NBRC 0211 / NRRL Y-12639) TaxID=1071378 RepID=G0WBU5_NAUDC|nr:hypothetical protein NDAI_0E03980 [Naumovozyma dairenensis CBS 421]CCD25215.1 hypothetical protein NDAI_0E03980 [Naumovozyma dairenensis CBS 421]
MGILLKSINRLVILPTAGFSLGVLTFMKAWPELNTDANEAGRLSLKDPGINDNAIMLPDSLRIENEKILNAMRELPLYKRLVNDPMIKHTRQSEGIPEGHKPNHVGQGILFGSGKLEIDPIIFHDEKNGEIVIFYHFGKGLSNEHGAVHKGILALILDEGLCLCGFPLLPSQRGVTAKLNLKFHADIPVDSSAILRAKVTEIKGRKCVIDGTLESVPQSYENPLWKLLNKVNERKPTTYVSANCILVEPKWFKYIKNLNIM